jgi:ribonuclease HIII
MEAVDTMFLQHLNFKHKAEQSLCSALSFSNSINNGNHKAATKFGTYPTGGNKAYMFNLVVDYTKEEHVMGIDEDGNQIIKYGVDFIEDIDLLKEMLNWRKGGNFDRITAFMHALAYARELDKKDIRPKDSLKDKFQHQINRVKPRLAVFGNRRPSAF